MFQFVYQQTGVQCKSARRSAVVHKGLSVKKIRIHETGKKHTYPEGYRKTALSKQVRLCKRRP